MPCNGDNVGIFRVTFDSIHGGVREQYVRACSEEEATSRFNGRAYSADYAGKVSQFDDDYDIRQKLNLDSSINFN